MFSILLWSIDSAFKIKLIVIIIKSTCLSPSKLYSSIHLQALCPSGGQGGNSFNYCILLPVNTGNSLFFPLYLCGFSLYFAVFRLCRLTFTTDILQTGNKDEGKISRWSDTLKRLFCSQVLIPVRPRSVFMPPGWTHFYYRIRTGRVRLFISLLMSQMFKKKKKRRAAARKVKAWRAKWNGCLPKLR